MSAETGPADDGSTAADDRQYPLGLSSRQFAIVVVLVGLIGPGLLVFVLEQANLARAADIVWVVGYGTAILVVWYIWLRPIELVGYEPSRDDPATDPSESTETGGTSNQEEGGSSANDIETDPNNAAEAADSDAQP
jgi:hypothetical protein